jgi:hypothetical protein
MSINQNPTQPAYQFDAAGLFLFETVAHASPREPGVYLVPAGCTLIPPPAEVPAGQWPRWNGKAWQLVNRPAAPAPEDPVAKLAAFLAANPDVAAVIQQGGV